MTSYPPILTTTMVAELLAISEKSVGRLPIPSSLIAGKRRYLLEDVLEFVKEKRDA